MGKEPRYEILSSLGKGGMAEVFLARHRESGQIVALKRLSMRNGTPTRELLQKEAQLVALFSHPNIVSSVELQVDEKGLDWVLEYVEGWDLARVLSASVVAKRRLPIAAIFHIIQSLCLALGHAHERGVLHRDVTPSNVLISKNGQVKLADFGIARAQDAPDSTTTGRLKGKIGYMSPEQASGEVLDVRSDLYSLSILFFEMVTGERLFRAADDLALLAMVRAPRIPPASARCEEVPVELDEFLLQGLSPARSGRFSSAAGMLQALKEVALVLNIQPQPENLRDFLAQLSLPPVPEIPSFVDSSQQALHLSASMNEVTFQEPLMPPPPRQPVRRHGSWQVLAGLLAGLVLGTGAHSFVHRWEATPLQVISVPPGAMLSLDGKEQGITPLETRLTSGQAVKVEVRKQGYRPIALLVPLRAGEAGIVHITLEPEHLIAWVTAFWGVAGCLFITLVSTQLGLPTVDRALGSCFTDNIASKRFFAVDIAACPTLADKLTLPHIAATNGAGGTFTLPTALCSRARTLLLATIAIG